MTWKQISRYWYINEDGTINTEKTLDFAAEHSKSRLEVKEHLENYRCFHRPDHDEESITLCLRQLAENAFYLGERFGRDTALLEDDEELGKELHLNQRQMLKR